MDMKSLVNTTKYHTTDRTKPYQVANSVFYSNTMPRCSVQQSCPVYNNLLSKNDEVKTHKNKRTNMPTVQSIICSAEAEFQRDLVEEIKMLSMNKDMSTGGSSENEKKSMRASYVHMSMTDTRHAP